MLRSHQKKNRVGFRHGQDGTCAANSSLFAVFCKLQFLGLLSFWCLVEPTGSMITIPGTYLLKKSS